MANPSLTPQFVARALKLNDQPAQSAPFPFVTSDSRKVGPGCLFVALAGENFDGHEFITQATQKGAAAILCKADWKGDAGRAHLFRATDTLVAYRQLAAAWRREFKLPVLMVAGSNGKTTTKELLAATLTGRFKNVLKTQGSENGFVGIPLTLLELRPEHDAAVIEVGIDEPGAMASHVELVAPTGAVLTAVGPEHLEKLRDIETVAREERLALSMTAKQGGFVAVNLNDPNISPALGEVGAAPKTAYALADTSEAARAELTGAIAADGKSLTLAGRAKGSVPLVLPGRHNALNTLSAAALALQAGLTADEIARGLATFKGVTARSELRELAHGTRVLCDYYNAQPLSVAAGLDLLGEIGKGRTKWACLADMLELGPNEESFHRELAARIAALEVRHVLLYGPRMKWLADELKHSATFKGSVQHYDSHSALAHDLISGLGRGDAVMIKGSRGMKMEEVWKPLSESAEWKPA